MPSNKKKRVHERMQKTGENYASALRSLRRALRITHGQYSGTPKLPQGRRTHYADDHGNWISNEGRPEIDVVHIQGPFDANNLKTAFVPETAFDDPSMPRDPSWPRDVKRVLSLAEYVDARIKQTGWRLESIQPGPTFMGQVLNVYVVWNTAPRGAL